MAQKHKADSQVTLILNHLKSGKSITPLEAWDKYQTYRLGACIGRLREEGHNISTEIVYFKKTNGNTGHYAVYRLEEEDNE